MSRITAVSRKDPNGSVSTVYRIERPGYGSVELPAEALDLR